MSEITEAMRGALSGRDLEGRIVYTIRPYSSSSVQAKPYPVVFDPSLTKAVLITETTPQITLATVSGWYDNVRGFTRQLLYLVKHVGNYKG